MSNGKKKELNKYGFDKTLEFSWKKLGKFLKLVGVTAKSNKILFTFLILSCIMGSFLAACLPLVASMMITALSNNNVEPTIKFLLWNTPLIKGCITFL
ncbi:hypothetical protein EELLY_v1c03120 [Entomoplasma ellychniae]|uniref:Uncharacterized protein n=1 Tax=Entomoplasma ellychniae TaxID=2114 RepID=A0A8E2QVV2_9MOLU|nr:hypothetical protein [Entomoplasma ellychniae]PPE04632.1 hypothetical protein EELLY_v1c03120 [Entomoplasma ellychniae]